MDAKIKLNISFALLSKEENHSYRLIEFFFQHHLILLWIKEKSTRNFCKKKTINCDKKPIY